MARKKERGNGSGTVYPRKNKQGKIIGYRGSYFAPDGKRRYVSAKRKGDAEKAPAPPKVLATENEAKGNRFLTQGVSGDSRGCHAR